LDVIIFITKSFRKPEAETRSSAWAPLAIPTYRAFWAASFFSNLGTWIHEVGAAWLMTELDPSPLMVSSVRAAMALPILLLALPAGAIADRVDRRRLLIGTQLWLLITAVSLATLTYCGLVTPTILLLLTAAAGLGMVMHAPSWQASIPELVPREQLTSAIALGSISFNLARALGPAVGGVLVAWFGSWSAFAVNAGSFAGVIGVLLLWKRTETESSGGRTFVRSIGDGVSFVVKDTTMRRVLIRVVLFVVPAGGLWALLPLVAHDTLDWGPRGYGLLVGGIGLGAVLAAGLMPGLRRRVGLGGVLLVAHLMVAVALVSFSYQPQAVISVLLTLFAGAGWMMTMTSLNSSAQMVLPRAVRARGMACYLTAFAAAMSGGSLLWGSIARQYSLEMAMFVAAIVMSISAVVGVTLKIADSN
jgi:MFS family permease